MGELEKSRKTHEELMALLDTVPGIKEHMESAEVKAELERYKRLVEESKEDNGNDNR